MVFNLFLYFCFLNFICNIMSDEKLFSEFPPVSTEAWEAIIEKDLKGADYEKKLVWKTDEGFKVRPYYRAEDLDNIKYLNSLPDQFPYTRGTRIKGNTWEIVQEIHEADPATANTIARDALKKGATTVVFNASKIDSLSGLNLLLQDIDLNNTGIQFDHARDYVALVTLFTEYLKTNSFDNTRIRGSIGFDPIVYFLKQTRFYHSREEDLGQIMRLLELTRHLPNFRVININGLALHNAGATIVQEIGYSLSIANEYMAYGTSVSLSPDEIAKKTLVTLSVGSNYFMEIAKLRAMRLLWATMINQYNPSEETSTELFINTVASTWNKTIYDPYVNMLRTTTEGMAAVIGGADSIALQPFDVAYKEDDEFSRRISRNVQSILKEESFFDKVADPAAGSYYIENLTDALCEHGWKLFQDTESKGGIIELAGKGEIKAEIEKSCQKRNMDIATRRYILLGTNQYPNTQEMMGDKVKLKNTEDAPGLKDYRGAMAFEEIRLNTEKYAGKHGRPKVFLLKVGNVAMRQARAGFATNFFGCAGYEILDNTGFTTIDEGVKAAAESNANIVVLCSSDEEYAALGPEAARKIKDLGRKISIVVAGNPTDAVELLKEAGVDEFIHVRTNVLESLQSFNRTLGIS